MEKMRAGLARKLDHLDFVANNPAIFLRNYFIALSSEIDSAVERFGAGESERICAALSECEAGLKAKLDNDGPVPDEELEKVRRYGQEIAEAFGDSLEDAEIVERCETIHQALDRDLELLKRRILSETSVVFLSGLLNDPGVLVVLESVHLRDPETQFFKQRAFRDAESLRIGQDEILDFLQDWHEGENRKSDAYKRNAFRNLFVMSDLPERVDTLHQAEPSLVYKISAPVGSSDLTIDGAVQEFQLDALEDSVKSLDVSGQHLTKLSPLGPAQVEALSLPLNLISEVESGALDKLSSLQSLTLNGNLLSTLDIGHLGRLERLHTLNLADNFLSQDTLKSLPTLAALLHLDLSANIFKAFKIDGLDHLQTINLSSCRIEQMPKSESASQLIELDISDNLIRSLPSTALVDHFETLQTLDLRNNLIKTVKANTFQSLSLLKSLNLDGNCIRTLETDAFVGLDALVSLSLAGNQLESVGPQVFTGLKSLETLDLGANLVRHVSRDVFHGLERLRRLNLGSNQLRSLEDSQLFQLDSLDSLDLSHNHIMFIKRGVFDRLAQMSRLDLSANSLVLLQELAFLYTNRLTKLDLSQSRLGKLTHRTLDGLDSLTHLSLNCSRVESIDELVFRGLTRLVELSLADNTIKSIHPNAFARLERLSRLDLAGNSIGSLDGRIFRHLSSLVELDLGQNRLRELPSDAFDGLERLETLRLNDNLIESLDDAGLERLTELKELDLSRNCIEHLKLSPVLNSLVKLDADANKLSELTSEFFDAVPKLRVLNVRYNRIGCVCSDVLPRLQELELLALTGNFVELLPGFETNKYRVVQANKLKVTRVEKWSLGDGSTGVLSLEDNNLSTIPEDFLAGLEAVSLKSNKLRCLQVKSAVRSLNASDNLIASVDFEGCEKLERLNLNGNRIRSFQGHWFRDLQSLRELSLASNSARSLEELFNMFESFEVLKKLKLQEVKCLLPKLEQLDLQSNLIEELKDFDFGRLGRTVKRLNLSWNRLAALESSFKRLWRLKELDLSHNSIETLATDAFNGCPKVSRLDLSYNKLKTLPVGLFARQLRLSYLNLSRNDLETLEDEALSIVGLLSLDLSNNKLGSLNASQTLKFSQRLRYLNASNNAIFEINSKSFDGFTKLLRLDLKDNGLTRLGASCFDGLFSLTELDLSGNRLESIEALAFGDLKRLKELNLGRNRLKRLGFFLELPRLVKLDLSGNAIDCLDSESLAGLSNLEELNLSHNSLSKWTRDISEMKRLKILNLEANLLIHIEPESFRAFSSLECLKLSNNRIESFEHDALKGLESLLLLELRNNPIKSLEYAESVDGFLKSMLQLKRLDVSGTNISRLDETSFTEDMSLAELVAARCQIESISLRSLRHLVRLELGHNKLNVLDRSCFKGLRALAIVDLRNNSIVKIEADTFVDCENLRELKLDQNSALYDSFEKISQISASSLASLSELSLNGTGLEQLKPRIFAELMYLRHLDLSSNQFELLRDDWFQGLTRLTRLNLSRNRLVKLVPFKATASLEVLDLSNNLFETFHLDFISNLSQLVELDLSGNKIESVVVDEKKVMRIQKLNLCKNSFKSMEEVGNIATCSTFIENLDLGFNQIDSISEESFLSQLANLKYLNLKANKLASVQFKENTLINLIELDLSSNEIENIDSARFDFLSSLQTLDLSKNPLASLRAEQIMLPSLKRLIFDGSIVKNEPGEEKFPVITFPTVESSNN